MDREDVIAMALENVLAGERQKKRRMEQSLMADQVALQEKKGDCSMLKRKNQEMLAKVAAKKKVVDDYKDFFIPTENNDLFQNFDQKEMMNTIATMMNSDAGDNGGFLGWLGDIKLHGIDLSPEEKAAIDALEALENGVGCVGGGNGGFARCHGGINNASENGHNGEEDKMTATEGTKCDGGEGSSAGGNGGFARCHGGINNASENAHNREEDKMTATEGTKCDGGEGSSAGDHGGN